MMQKMQQTLPIIPWMGGKRRLAKHLLPMFPEHSCYVELFSGGAALFFMRPVPAKVEVLNDINGQLINLYRVVQHHFDEFVRQFEWTLTSRETFACLQNTPPASSTFSTTPSAAKPSSSISGQLPRQKRGMHHRLRLN